MLKSHTTRKHKVEVLRIDELDVSLQFSVTDNSRDEDVYDNQDMNIYQKVALNTLSSEIINCYECDAKFPDEPELYDELFWFIHRSIVCNLKYKGCHTKPSDDYHPFSGM